MRGHLGTPSHGGVVTQHSCSVDKHGSVSTIVLRPRPGGVWYVGRDVGQGTGKAALAVPGAPERFIERARVEIRLWEVLHTSFLPYGCSCSCWGTAHASLSYFNSLLSWCFTPGADCRSPFLGDPSFPAGMCTGGEDLGGGRQELRKTLGFFWGLIPDCASCIRTGFVCTFGLEAKHRWTHLPRAVLPKPTTAEQNPACPGSVQAQSVGRAELSVL